MEQTCGRKRSIVFAFLTLWLLGLWILMGIAQASVTQDFASNSSALNAPTVESPAVSEAHLRPYVIGVLALNSIEEAQDQWQPLADYLNEQMPNYGFEIKSLDFHQILPAIEKAEIDFMIANPAFYAISEQKYQTYAIATLVKHTPRADVFKFGGVVFSQFGVDVEDIAKLHQEEMGAVAPFSLGGYLVQKKFFKDKFNIDLNDRRITFYQSHRDVVNAVLAGEKKVGLVRTGILESMQKESMVELFHLPDAPSYQLLLSTKLYPEWPFAALKHIPMMDAEKVLIELLEWQSEIIIENKFAKIEDRMSWSIPQSYQPIMALLKEFDVAPYSNKTSTSLKTWLEQYQEWAIFFIALLLGVILMASLLSRKVLTGNAQQRKLDLEIAKRDDVIAELELANQTLSYQQDRFHVLSDTSNQGVVIFSFSGHIEYINPHALKFWGKEHSTVDRLNAYHLFSDVNDRHKIHQMMESLNESTQSPVFLEEFSAELVAADGNIKTTSIRLSALQRKGKWLVVLNFNDHSENQLLETSYRQAMLLAQTYIEQSNQVVFTFDTDFELQTINSKACDLLAKDREYPSFCGKQEGEKLPLENISSHHIEWLRLWFSEEEQAELVLELNELMREDRPSHFDYLVLPSHQGPFEGYNFHFSFIKNELLDEAFFMCIAQDVSVLENVKQGFQNSNQLLDSVINQNQTGILILDAQGLVQYCNHAVENLMQVSRKELLGSEFGIPSSLNESRHQEFEILTADGSSGLAELIYTETLWQGEKAFFVLMNDVTDIKAAQAEMSYRSLHDSLTGLPNRRLLIRQLDNLIEANRFNHSPFSLVFVDIDRFKQINDTFGHRVGDELLLQIAHKLKETARSSDTVTRLAGDVFALILPGMENQELLNSFMSKLCKVFEDKLVFSSGSLKVFLNIGAVIHPNYGHNSADLLKMAEMAKNFAKRSQSRYYKLFNDKEMGASLNAYSLENELNRAVLDNEFCLYYQPQFHAETGQLVGVEALLRWNHPTRGILAPDLFLSTLEHNGKIDQLGIWVLEQCLLKLKDWQFADTHKRLAINLSARQLLMPELSAFLAAKLAEYEVSAKQLAIEISENTLLHDPHHVALVLQSLHEMGVEIHLDNLGSEFSTLARLKNMPIDWVKIERNLISLLAEGKTPDPVVKALVESLQSLGIQVVALGVENITQQQALLAQGCEIHQGYLYCEPVDEKAFEAKYLQGESQI